MVAQYVGGARSSCQNFPIFSAQVSLCFMSLSLRFCAFAGVPAAWGFCCNFSLQLTNMFTIDHDPAGVSNPQILPRRNSPEQSGMPQGKQISADFLGLGSHYTSLVLFGLTWHGLCLYQNLYSPQRRRGRRDWFFIVFRWEGRKTINWSPTGYKWTPKNMCFSDVFEHPGEIETEDISFPLRTLRLAVKCLTA